MTSAPAGSPGDTQLQSPPLSNAGADPSGSSGGGGCSSCSQSGGAPGAFNLAVNLGNNGTADVIWNYSGNLAQADLLTSASFTASSELRHYPGVVVTGDPMPTTVVVSNPQSSPPTAVATTTFAYSYNAGVISTLTITVTPSDTTQPVTTHTFTRATQAAYTGVQYTRAVTGGSTETMAFYNSGVAGTVADSNMIQGVFRTVNTAGDVETLTAPPQTSGTFTWVADASKPNGGYFSGTYSETNELDPADPAQPTVTTLRTYRKIGTSAENLTVLVSEEVTQAGVTTSTLYGYDETPSFTNVLDPTKVYSNSNFGAQMWSAVSDGTWNLTVLELFPDLYIPGQYDYGDSFAYEPWQDGPTGAVVLLPDMSNAGAVQSFFTGLISTASSSSYVLGGCKRTRTTDATVQTGLSVSWQTRTITSICLEGGSTVDLGIEYSYAQGGSEMVSASSFGVQGNFYRTSRSERWNAAGIADWSAAGATAQWNATYGTTDMTQTLTVDQTGVAQVTVMNEQADGSASQDVKKVQAVPLWAGYNYYRTPADMNLGDGHPLWSTTGTDTQGRTVSETARYGDGGTTIQTIGTTYSAGGGSTRSYINQNGDTVTLSYQSDGVTSGGQTTTTSTDAQGITTTTVTDATTGNLISETRQGVTTNYATTTNADGSTTQTVTQTAGGEAPRTQSVTVADAQGRTLSVTDANGSITQYDYSNHGRTVTQTLPSGGTRVTTNYLDGQLNSITGTAVTPEYHHYTVNDGSVAPYEAGSITETVYYITDNSSCWSKTTTNFLGQTLLREVPSPSGSGTSATTYTYNGLGQLVKTSSPGMADLITAYDEWGNVSQQGCDMDGDGALTVRSTDVLTATTTAYLSGEGTVLQTVTSQRYTLSDGTALQTVNESKLLEGSSWQRTTQADGTVITQSGQMVGGAYVVSSQQSVTGSQSSSQTYQNGLLMSETLPGMSSAVTYDYNGFGQTWHVVHPLNGTTTSTYDSVGRLYTQGQSEADGGNTATYTYYSTGDKSLVQQMQNTGGSTITYTYDLQGRMLTQNGSADYPLRYEYDGMGRLWKLHTYRSGALGDVNSGDVTTWNYDAASGVLLSKTDAAGRSVSYTYDTAGRQHTRTWQRQGGITTTYGYDDAGRRKSIDYSDGTPDVVITYDRAGRPASITDAAGAHSLTYDDTTTSGGKLKHWSVDGSGAWSGLSQSYGYTAGQRSSRTTSLGGMTLPGVSYSYNTASGQMAGVSASDFAVTYNYDTSTGWFNGVSYTGGPGSMRTPGGLGRLNSISWSAGGAVVSSHGYTLIDAQGRRKTVQRQDGSIWSYGYNNRGEVTSAAKGTEPGKQFAFDYDGIGNRTTSSVSSLTDASVLRTTTYTPNELNQYATITHPQPGWLVLRGSILTTAGNSVTIDGNAPTLTAGSLWFHEQSVDNSAGPVRSVVDIAATRSDGGLNGSPVTTHQKGALFIPPPSEVPIYDLDGNLSSDARWNYTWDGENRLIAVEEKTGIAVQPAGTVTRKRLEFSYDARGRRISKNAFLATGSGGFVLQQSLVFLYDSWNMIAEIDTTSAQLLRSYEWGMDLSGTMTGAGGVGGLLMVRCHTAPTSGTYAPCYDGNGNVTELVNLTNGSISARYEYGAFGETISTDGGAVAAANPFRFSTKYLDVETGLYNYGYRSYDVANGRWLNRDPIGERGGINLYGMVGNDPVNRWDYLGLAYGIPATSPNCEVILRMSHGPRTSQTWLDQYYLSIKQLVVSSGGSPGLYDNGDLPFYGSAAVMACQQQAFGRFWTPGVNGNTGDVWASNGRGWTPSAAPNANAFGPPRPDAGVVPVTNGGYGPGPGFSNGNFFRYIRDSIQASLNHAKTLAGRCAQDGCCKCTNIKVKFQLDDYTRGAHGNTAKGDYIHGMRTGGAQNWINNQGGALDVSGAEPDPPTKSSLPQQPGDSPLPFGEREWTFPVQRK